MAVHGDALLCGHMLTEGLCVCLQAAMSEGSPEQTHVATEASKRQRCGMLIAVAAAAAKVGGQVHKVFSQGSKTSDDTMHMSLALNGHRLCTWGLFA